MDGHFQLTPNSSGQPWRASIRAIWRLLLRDPRSRKADDIAVSANRPWHPERHAILLALSAVLGSAVYFILPIEPAWLVLGFLFIATFSAASGLPKRRGWQAVALCLGVIVGAMLLAKYHVTRVDTDLLRRPMTVRMTATVQKIERMDVADRATNRGAPKRADQQDKEAETVARARARQARLIVCDLTPERPRRFMPRCARIIIRTAMPDILMAGDRVSLLARLEPLPGPAIAGGYDGRLALYMQKIAAQGYALSPVMMAETGNAGSDQSIFLSFIGRIRGRIGTQVAQSLDGDAYGLAVALMIGQRGAVSDEALEALRDAGLAHLLAISGLHMGLIAGFAFLTIKFLWSRSTRLIRLCMPTKAAAVGALLIALMYLLLSGMAVSTIRAFIMVAIGLIAVLLHRQILSMRSVAVAAVCILLLSPHAVFSIGFQMSFAATAALIWAYEGSAFQERGGGAGYNHPMGLGKLMGKGRQFFLATLVATIVAQLAIAPFALFHFGTVSATGALANLIVMPLMTIIIMPLCLLGLFLASIDGFNLVAPVLGWSLEQVIETSRMFAQLPGATLTVPALGTAVLLAIIGGLLVCLLRPCWLAYGAACLAIAFPVFTNDQKAVPSLLVSAAQRGDRVSMIWYDRDAETIRAYGARQNSFRMTQFKQKLGLADDIAFARLRPICDDHGCVFKAGAVTLAAPTSPMALMEDCVRADYVILPPGWGPHSYAEKMPKGGGEEGKHPCATHGGLLDRSTLARQGPYLLTAHKKTMIPAHRPGARPWNQ